MTTECQNDLLRVIIDNIEYPFTITYLNLRYLQDFRILRPTILR